MFRLAHVVRSRIWLVPLACLAAGIGLAIATIAIDRAVAPETLLRSIAGTPSAARTILSTGASALVTLTSVVLSLTLVAVQLAMGQFSPRIVRAILTDRRNQLAIGLFAGTFAYTIVVQREINDLAPGGGAVPGLSVVVGYGLLLASVAAMILFVHHAGQSIRVSGLIDLVGDETRAQLERTYPPAAATSVDPTVIAAPEPGVVARLNYEGLVAAAAAAGCVLEMTVAMGDFVPRGAPLFHVRGELTRRERELVLSRVVLGPERLHEDDPAYGFRKLVDIAERAIASSPYDDPSTTVQALQRLHDCLRLLASRPFPDGCFRDADGNVRLTTPVLSWDGYVRLAFDEIRIVGAGSPQVARYLRSALEDLKQVAWPAERRTALDRQLALLDAAVERAYEDGEDAAAARRPDNQGIGSGRDVVWPDELRAGAGRERDATA